ncbi:RNA ligase partner protein [archaeon SCG-AAA382B04]|nr:RNA ligase partner protein [archaeon SCG-AAA382B04]
MVERQYFVLDTTALTDVETRKKEGYDSLCEGMSEILDLISQARLKLNISCYVPYPTVYKEITEFINRYECGEEVEAKVDTWLVKKTPNRYEVDIPAGIFYEYVDYMRGRINKGMNVAEDAIWEASMACLDTDAENLSDEEIEKEVKREMVGGTVSDFRDKYRDALRYGILDSAPDIDVLLLAKELDAAVVGADDGIEKWAERLGLRFVRSSSFPQMIKEYLSKQKKIEEEE